MGSITMWTSSKIRSDLRDEPIEIATQFVEWSEHCRNEQRGRSRRFQLLQLLTNLIGRSSETCVARIGNVPAHAGRDGFDKPIDLFPLVRDQQHHIDRPHDGLAIAANCCAM